MNKKALLAGIASAFLLLGCSGPTGSSSDYASMIVANNNQADYVPITYSGNSDEVTPKYFNDASTQNVTPLGYGLMAVTTEHGYVGFYSLFYGDYLVQPRFIPEYLSYSVSACEIGSILKINYRNNTYYYDSMGNSLLRIVYSSSNNRYSLYVYDRSISSSALAPEITQIDGKDFTFITDEDGDQTYTYIVCRTNTTSYHYGIYDNSTGKITTLSTNPLIGLVDSSYEAGDTYFDRGYTDLSDYGMAEGYYLYQPSSNYYVVMKSGVLVCSFTLPETAAMAIYDGKILYQYSTILPDDSATYDYFTSAYDEESGGYVTTKYDLSTFSLDLISGEPVDIIVNYVMTSLSPFKDENGIYNYGVAEANAIESNLSLSKSDETYILSSTGSIFYNATSKSVNDIIKLDDDHYYDTAQKILYDADLNVISFLTGVSNVSVDRSGELIIGSINGFYGAMDYNLKVVIPFEYETSFTRCENGYTMASKNGVYYRIKLEDSSAEELGQIELNQIAQGCYYYYEENSEGGYDFTFLSSEKQLGETVNVSESTIDAGYVSCSLNNSSYAYAILRDSDEEGNVYYVSETFYTTPFPNSSSFQPSANGEELTAEYEIGDSFENALSLAVGGNNLLTITSQSGNFYSLDVLYGYSYQFSFSSPVYASIYGLDEESGEYTALSSYSESARSELSYSPSESGTVYLQIADPSFPEISSSGNGFSNYILNISRNSN
ncbi:MAG: hypothetical protein Q4F15_02285 [Bacillota bacterium]|nr:hypothetical protein [Bacillota bacterium]